MLIPEVSSPPSPKKSPRRRNTPYGGNGTKIVQEWGLFSVFLTFQPHPKSLPLVRGGTFKAPLLDKERGWGEVVKNLITIG